MSIKRSGSTLKWWKRQPPIDWIDTSIVQDAWETVTSDLSSGKKAKIFVCLVEQTNNGATAEDLEIEITINGTAYTWSLTANSGTPYYLFMNATTLSGTDFLESSSTSAYAFGNFHL